MLLQGLLISVSIALLCFRTVCGSLTKKYFYIYETGYWPNISVASLAKRDVNERLENLLNAGAGPISDMEHGAYHTDQYQMFSMIYNRALKDPRRTLDPAKATSFIIPYDFASDAAFYKNCARSAGVCYDFRKCPLAPTVEELLMESPWFKRNQGRDHLLIVGMNYAMDHYILKPKCKSLLLTCTNCTKFAIDDYSYMYSGDAGIQARGDIWNAAPFPADFHWTPDVKTPYPWENTQRKVLVSYVGSTGSFYGPAKRLRGSIAHYCGLHPVDCAHQTYGLNGTRFSFKVDGHNPLQLSGQSIFCFQPIGDLMTRKGLFDSLLQGCIPVVFDQLTAQVMYTWHWEESFWKEIIIEFPFHPVAHRYFDPVEALKTLYKNNATEIEMKQKKIRDRVFELQYGLDGLRDMYYLKSALPYVVLTFNKTYGSSGDSDAIVLCNMKEPSTCEFAEDNVKTAVTAIAAGIKAGENVVVVSNVKKGTWPRQSGGPAMTAASSATDSVMDAKTRRYLRSTSTSSSESASTGGAVNSYVSSYIVRSMQTDDENAPPPSGSSLRIDPTIPTAPNEMTLEPPLKSKIMMSSSSTVGAKIVNDVKGGGKVPSLISKYIVGAPPSVPSGYQGSTSLDLIPDSSRSGSSSVSLSSINAAPASVSKKILTTGVGAAAPVAAAAAAAHHTTVASSSSGAYMRDAYGICMDLLLFWHSGGVRFRNATVPECWDGWLDTKANKCQPGEEPKK